MKAPVPLWDQIDTLVAQFDYTVKRLREALALLMEQHGNIGHAAFVNRTLTAPLCDLFGHPDLGERGFGSAPITGDVPVSRMLQQLIYRRLIVYLQQVDSLGNEGPAREPDEPVEIAAKSHAVTTNNHGKNLLQLVTTQFLEDSFRSILQQIRNSTNRNFEPTWDDWKECIKLNSFYILEASPYDSNLWCALRWLEISEKIKCSVPEQDKSQVTALDTIAITTVSDAIKSPQNFETISLLETAWWAIQTHIVHNNSTGMSKDCWNIIFKRTEELLEMAPVHQE